MIRRIHLTCDELDKILTEGLDRTPEELFCVKKLNEVNLNRLKKHGKAGFIIISACRSTIEHENPNVDLTSEYLDWAKRSFVDEKSLSDRKYQTQFLKHHNYVSDGSLETMLRSSSFPYSFSAVYGGYHGQDGSIDSFEPSYVIYNHKKDGTVGDWNDLYRLALTLCRDYHQESVYIQAPGQPPVYKDCDGNTVSSKSSTNFKYNREGEEYFTTAKKEKRGTPQRFTADIQFENYYIGPKPADYGMRMKASKQGEIIL